MDDQAAFIFYHLLLSSSSEEDSDDEVNVRAIRGAQNLRPRIQNFIEEVVNHYRNEEFREHFRMFRATFNHILTLIENELIPDDCTGRYPVMPKTQLLFTIWYFATPDCYRSICSRFNIGKATALRTVRRVTNALLTISNTLIKWPAGDYMEAVKNAFDELGFPNTVGALDGCYIPIPTPKEYGLSYICRKGFAALILQGDVIIECFLHTVMLEKLVQLMMPMF